MIQFLLPLLILPAQTTAPMEQRYAEPMYRTGFEQADDLNYDGWPDKWTRQRGLGYPHYVDIGIAADPDASATGDAAHCLRMDLDGGAAALFSPPIEVSSQFSYTLQGKLKTWGLTHDVAYLSVAFLDQDQQQQEVYLSDKLTRVDNWRELTIGPLTPSRSDARFAVIGLHLAPTTKEDLIGSALFDDICFARFPNMTLEANRPHNLFAAGEVPEITCTVSGIRRDGAVVIFELVDVSGRTVLAEQKMLANADDPLSQLTWAAEMSDSPTSNSSAVTDQGGTVTWHPRLPDLGYYTIRAVLRSDDRVTLQRTISIAVLRDLGTQRKGEYGWSLARDTHQLSDQQLLNLLTLVNASWVKYPVWYGPADDEVEGDRIADLADRLSATGIEMVGVFDTPPANVFKRLGQKGHLSVAEAFLEPSSWQPAIDPLMVRLSLKIRWWQLGTDHDESFIDYQGLEEKIGEIRTHFKKYGQRTRLGLPWQWLQELPSAQQEAPWDFLSLSESPPFTSSELARYAETTQQAPDKTWVTLTPLPRHNYDFSARAQDLILRMVQAKIDGVSAIFADNPFDETCGLLSEDGTPNELFLPWCITSKLIGGAKYLGSLQLPNDSQNHVFAVDDQAVMVVWNKTPVTESLYLGEDVVRVDPWGRATVLSRSTAPEGELQTVEVGPLPVFVRGLNLAVARWRMGFQFEPNLLESTFNRRQSLNYRVENPLQHGVAGTLSLHVPEVWEVNNSQLRFKLGAGESLSQSFPVLLFANASSGPQNVRIDFELQADKVYRFSVYRRVNVGMGDVVADLDTWLDDKGRLIVEQRLMNTTNELLDFNCYLYAPGRRRMRLQVFDTGPGRVTHTFTLHDGASLIGKPLWLRIEEINGSRLQNYHVIAEP